MFDIIFSSIFYSKNDAYIIFYYDKVYIYMLWFNLNYLTVY